MNLQKKDFIEIEFTAKIKNGEIFDSNIKEDLLQKGVPSGAKNINLKSEHKPFIFCLGEGMFLKGIEDFLIGKEIGEYKVELSPEKAFGKRNPSFIQMMPMKIFREQKINPIPGIMFNFDGRIAKILTASSGRVMVDFNNPIAGKDVEYKIKVLRKVDDLNEKIKAFIEFLFKRDLKFEVKDKKIILEVEKQMIKIIELFKDNFKKMFDMDLEVKEIKEAKEIKED
ncbi:MAG: peptidylprolyl isomerase [Nanoarchaeota archaeon]|nr:peptidylprolyl isomerase [Nanoarchaeota archaeon]MBU4116729.1 peptidylprolyl isomerase [Nanoarchaeota archaeon]